MSGRANARLWGGLPAKGPFAVVSPDGSGARVPRYSWGAPGQVRDLARLPSTLQLALPWLRIDRRRVYAIGGSMGGQEALLLLARRPRLLAGVAAFDAVTDLAEQYRRFRLLRCLRACRRTWNGPIGVALQSLARAEVGGSPGEAPARYARRSPISFTRAIARSCVPLQLWWSRKDRVVRPATQSARFLREVRRWNGRAPVEAFVGTWRHTYVFRAKSLLPVALARFGLLPATREVTSVRHVAAPRRHCKPRRTRER